MTVSFEEHAKLVQRAHSQFAESIQLKTQMLEGDYLETLSAMAQRTVQALAKGGKLLLCGNGGSASDAQHLAAELLIRLRPHTNRASIPAMSLIMDSSTLTACANDYGYEALFERMVQSLGKPEDVLLGLTTSGRSANVTRALKAARAKGIATLGFLGGGGGQTLAECDLALLVPSTDPGRVQEVHITAGHILMDLIEHLLLEQGQIQLG